LAREQASHLRGPPAPLPPLLSDDEAAAAKAAFDEALRCVDITFASNGA